MGVPVSKRSVMALQYIPPGNGAGVPSGWRDIYDDTYTRTDLPAPKDGYVPEEFSTMLRDEGFDVVVNLNGVMYVARKDSL